MSKQSPNESPNEFFTQAAWAAMWNPQSDYYLPNVIKNGIQKEGVKVDPMGFLDLGSVPASGSFQLMKSDNLAPWLPVKTGYVGIQFTNVKVSNMENISNQGLTYTDNSDSQGTISTQIGVPNILISGDYTLVATGLAECALDTAAILPSFKADKMNRVEGSADPVSTDNYLDAARDQRTRLWQTKNGGVFMDKFYDHNEVYNFSFQNNNGLKNSWTQPQNQHFMGTTYDASQNPDTPVNGQTYKTANNDAVDYNTNAFNQKLAVAYAAYGYSNNPPPSSNITKQQFLDAAYAAQQFEGTVGQTGNTKQNTVPMSVNDVFGTIEAAGQDGRMYVLESGYPANYDEFMASLTDGEKEYLAKMGNVDKNLPLFTSGQDANATLMTGSFTVTISGGTLTLGAVLTFTTDPELKATANVTSFTSNINISSVDITNQPSWLGLKSIGQSVIDAYNNSGQIASLMQDKANQQLGSDDVKNYISGWLNTTLQKLLGNF
jgi:hypothetical protein